MPFMDGPYRRLLLLQWSEANEAWCMAFNMTVRPGVQKILLFVFFDYLLSNLLSRTTRDEWLTFVMLFQKDYSSSYSSSPTCLLWLYRECTLWFSSLSHLSINSVVVTLLVHFSIVLFWSHCVLKQNNWEVYLKLRVHTEQMLRWLGLQTSTTSDRPDYVSKALLCWLLSVCSDRLPKFLTFPIHILRFKSSSGFQ